jgi:hypothetical protein
MKPDEHTQPEEEAVTPCTRDYVAMNGWLSKGRNRLTSGTARNPCFKRLKTHAQRALNAKNGRNPNERDERVTPAELPPSVETLRKGKEHSKRRLESNAGITSQWHLKLYRRNAHMQAGCSSPVQRTKQAHT